LFSVVLGIAYLWAIQELFDESSVNTICFADLKFLLQHNSFQIRWIVQCQLKNCLIFLLHFINMYWIRETSSAMNDTMSHDIYILRTLNYMCLSINNCNLSNPILWSAIGKDSSIESAFVL
jgi:hypothetical protein